MLDFRMFIISLALVVLATACTTSQDKKRGTVHCPACGAELDALFEKHF